MSSVGIFLLTKPYHKLFLCTKVKSNLEISEVLSKMASNYTLTNTTLDYNNQSGINFTMLCPIYSESDRFWKETIAFWLDGVIKTVVAIFGILTNILAAYILMKPKMKSSFNLSLVALNVIDSIFLLGSVLESFKLR